MTISKVTDYTVYMEAQRRSREDIRQEIAEIQNRIECGEITEAEWRSLTDRLDDLYYMLRLKDIEDRNRDYQRLHSYGRWGL